MVEAGLSKTERLIRTWVLLLNMPFRFTARDLAERFDVNVRTIYRDLDILAVAPMVPVLKMGKRFGIEEIRRQQMAPHIRHSPVIAKTRCLFSIP